MIQTPEDRRPPLTPQLALRVAIIGSFALAMFAIIFFRLWFLQVLSGDQYLAQARGNRARVIAVPAPRGQILDRSGTVLVDSLSVPAVLISPPNLPVSLNLDRLAQPPLADRRVYDHLAGVLGMPTRPERCTVLVPKANGRPRVATVRLSPIACKVAQKWATLPYADVQIKIDVPKPVQYYLAERQDEFPGVEVQTVWLRKYPLTTLAAQLFGTVGPISCVTKQTCELHDPHFRGASQSDIVGQSGLEYYYDHYLRGQNGSDRVQVDALGRFRGELPSTQPVQGNSLKLSLDYKLQQVGQSALAHSMSLNASPAGAFVAMNPDTGEIYAMGSLPSFDPNDLTHPITTARYDQLFGPGAGSPQLDRAIQSAGPTGSTFKPITAVAALQSGAWSTGQTFDDTGQYCVSGQCRHNAGNASYGVLGLVDAIRVSSDDFFYNLGALTNVTPVGHPLGGALQHWASAFGIGRATGVDLGGEVNGNLPTPRWRDEVNQTEARCDRERHLPPGGCGIADGTNRPWSVGDNESLAVGQGDVQVTPLQLAVAYSALANGGNVVRPHLGLEIDAPNGTFLSRIAPAPVRHLTIDPTSLDTVRAGLRAAASQPGGTSAQVFSNFPEQVYGKTGTAQYTNQQDYSWYACFVPSSATRTPIVVIVKVERGGFGAVAAAPVARQILSQWFFGNPGPYVAGSSKTL